MTDFPASVHMLEKEVQAAENAVDAAQKAYEKAVKYLARMEISLELAKAKPPVEEEPKLDRAPYVATATGFRYSPQARFNTYTEFRPRQGFIQDEEAYLTGESDRGGIRHEHWHRLGRPRAGFRYCLERNCNHEEEYR